MDHYNPSQSKDVQIAEKILNEEIIELKNIKRDLANKKIKNVNK